MGLIPGQVTKTPQATWYDQKVRKEKKRKEKKRKLVDLINE